MLSEQRATLITYFAFLAIVASAGVLIVFAHRGIAPCLLAMGLIAAFAPTLWQDGKRALYAGIGQKAPQGLLFLILFGMTLWIAITALWSPIGGAAKLAVNVLVPALSSYAVIWRLGRFNSSHQAGLITAFIGAVVFAAVFLLIEALSGGALRDIIPPKDQSPERFKDMTALGRGMTILTLLVFPAMVLVWQRMRAFWVCLVLFAISLIAAANLTIAANTGALLVGGVSFLIAMVRPRLAVRLSVFTIIALILATPLLALLPADQLMASLGERLPPSWHQRLAIWEASGQAIQACLPLGCGADYARSLKETWQMIEIPGSPILVSAMPTHPHQLFMQLWMELGLPGVLIALSGVVISGRFILSARQLPNQVIAAGVAVLAIFTFSSLVEASLWQVWRLCALGFAFLGIALSYFINQTNVQ